MTEYKENYYTYRYKVEITVPIPLKEYLTGYCDYSTRLIRKIKREGKFLVDGKQVNVSYPVHKGDIAVAFLGQEKIDANPENIPINIIHEDQDLLIVNKEPGIVTHATLGHPTGNLANAIAHHWQNTGVKAKIRFVNRLDRDTSGVIVIAKNAYAHQFIQNQMVVNNVEKVYLAIVDGIIEKNEDTISAPIGRPFEDSIERVVMKEGQNAITHYVVLRRFTNHTLIQLELETGRTHQIRVHTKSIGYPIIGDNLYNANSMEFIQRQALHAKSIKLLHPRTKKTM